ncbi:hypothetical protein NLJ89_g9366 [Agrocybe chaxingu]|uniref:Extracellular metalloproteinase n=1 Tax=Agrocybe chaxingu TaxID=84603 RepID=A0A9W8JTF5_9AGAR|nr:hypothetical protein NLJ89_g9366 [Agrocybe chaxingu]
MVCRDPPTVQRWLLLVCSWLSFASHAGAGVASCLSRRGATYRLHTVVPDVAVEAYHPTSVYETYGDGLQIAFSTSGQSFNIDSIINSFLVSKPDVNVSALQRISALSTERTRFAYYVQSHDSISFINAGVHVGLDAMTGKVFAFSSSFFSPVRISSPRPSASLDSALPQVEEFLRGKARSKPTQLAYLARSDGSASLYYAIPIQRASIAEGQEMIVNPEDYEASPLGWHNDGKADMTVTSGNNTLSFKWLDPGYAYSNGKLSNSADPDSLTFSIHYNTALPLDNPTNLEAARTNAFYVMNVMHDVFYRYGFTEDAFNFQVTNLRGSGMTKAADPVRLSVQAQGAGVNNAFFASPAEYVSFIAPNRDGAIANDILVHEVTHGLTQRMTGGGTSRCLQTLEAEGLGEGWSDIMAEFVQLTGGEMRDYAFATAVHEVADIGEVWGNILHNILAVLIDKYGWSSAAMTDPSGPEGNIVYLHLFIDALPLQPCNPTCTPSNLLNATTAHPECLQVVQARDAFIQADAIRYDGVNKCLLWRVFAGRGLGVNAANYIDDSTIPDDC